MSAPPADPTERVAVEVSHELMSPYCPGRTIATCPSPAARKLEDDILAMLRAGKTKDEVVVALEQRFGDRVGAHTDYTPVVLTLVVAAIAAASIVAVGRRWRAGHRRHAASSAAQPPTPAPAGTAARGPTGALASPLDAAAADEQRALDLELRQIPDL